MEIVIDLTDDEPLFVGLDIGLVKTAIASVRGDKVEYDLFIHDFQKDQWQGITAFVTSWLETVPSIWLCAKKVGIELSDSHQLGRRNWPAAQRMRAIEMAVFGFFHHRHIDVVFVRPSVYKTSLGIRKGKNHSERKMIAKEWAMNNFFIDPPELKMCDVNHVGDAGMIAKYLKKINKNKK